MKVSRRRALIIIATAVAGFLGYKYISSILYPERDERAEKETSVEEGATRREAEVGESKYSEVSVVRGVRDPRLLARKVVEQIGGIEKIVGNKDRVVIKPNVGFPSRDAVASPEVVAEIAKMVIEAGVSEVIVAESSVRGYVTSFCFEKTKYYDVLKPLGIEVIDLKEQGNIRTVKAKNTLKLGEVDVYEETYTADILISVAKMKRHVSADVTLGIKNLIGCFPDYEKGRFHREGLHKCIADIAYILKPDLVVIDGSKAMTKHGPSGGVMVEANTAVASTDPLAADYIAAKILFELEGEEDPAARAKKVKYFGYAEQLGVGTMDEDKIKVVTG